VRAFVAGGLTKAVAPRQCHTMPKTIGKWVDRFLTVAPAQTQVCCYYNKRLPGGGKRTAEACTDCQKMSPALGDAEALGDANESVHRVEVGRRMGGDVSKTLALDHLDGGRIVDDLRMKLRNQRLDTPKPPEVFLQQRALSPLDVNLNQVHIGARG